MGGSPRRHSETVLVRERLGHLTQLVDEHRGPGSSEPGSRELDRCALVLVWKEPDGSGSISVLGDPAAGRLELQDLLRGGLVAIARSADPTSEALDL